MLLGSSSSILTRYARGIPPSSIGFWRVAGAALFLAPWAFAVWRKENRPRVFTLGVVLTGLLFGLHFATWSWSLLHTNVANALLFVGLQPLIAPFIAYPLLKERLNRRELVGCLLACVGMVWILGEQFHMERQEVAGSLVAFLSAILCAAYLVLSRKYRSSFNIMIFSFGVYTVAALVQAGLGLALNGGIYVGQTWGQNLAVLGLILLPTVGGHTLSMFLLKHVKSQMMALSVPAQFIFGTLAAYFLALDPLPKAAFWIGALLVMAGVVFGLTGAQQTKKP